MRPATTATPSTGTTAPLTVRPSLALVETGRGRGMRCDGADVGARPVSPRALTPGPSAAMAPATLWTPRRVSTSAVMAPWTRGRAATTAQLAGDGCDASCGEEAGYLCAGEPSVCTPECGDSIVVGGEVCDGFNVGAETCTTRGFDGGSLGCSGTCDAYDEGNCVYTCGNAVASGTEACDGADLRGETCASRGSRPVPSAASSTAPRSAPSAASRPARSSRCIQ